MADDPDSEPFSTVLETADDSRLAIAKSLLDDAGIDYLVQGDEALGLFPLGAFGRGPFRHGVAARIRVRSAQETEARALLAALTEGDDDAAPETGPSDDDHG